MLDVRSLHVCLVKPSKYDADGYVVHHFRGVLPCNTLNALNGLFRSALERLNVAHKISIIDETVELVKPEALMKKLKQGCDKILVGLVGVQSNQFPRAADLAVRFKKAGAMVIMGGFHISGTKALLGGAKEIDKLQNDGVSLFLGEAEGRIDELIADAMNGELKTEYGSKNVPDLSQDWAPPLVDDQTAAKFAVAHTGTMDTSRGCPFKCSFCTIIHVQGNKMRFRSTEIIEKHIREHYPNIPFYFFTDDNMSRNPHWPEIFDSLTKMREEEGMDLQFMMQVDVPSYKIPGFVERARRAGCQEVFVGLESLNPDNLKAAGKTQNDASGFQTMVSTWHEHGIPVHTAYIIGFPFDTKASVAQDVKMLTEEIRPDQASFFMLTPLPGSVDHQRKLENNEWMSPDLNEYDSFHAVSDHPLMSRQEWEEAYDHAFNTFYSHENLVRILSNAKPSYYWRVFKNAAWYRNSWFTERAHPMITGFWRLKGRTERRPSFKMEGRFQYFMRRFNDTMIYSKRLISTVLFMESIWRETWLLKYKRELTEQVTERVQNTKDHHNVLRKKFSSIVVGWTSSLYLHLGNASARWKRTRQLVQTGRIWDPRIYLNTVWASVLSVFEVLTKGWLFMAHFVMET
ncbi:MAG: B12-binding domain-containing radical SAM protein [Armatimonadota bacterium]